jgi:hypothetical protein
MHGTVRKFDGGSGCDGTDSSATTESDVGGGEVVVFVAVVKFISSGDSVVVAVAVSMLGCG